MTGCKSLEHVPLYILDSARFVAYSSKVSPWENWHTCKACLASAVSYGNLCSSQGGRFVSIIQIFPVGISAPLVQGLLGSSSGFCLCLMLHSQALRMFFKHYSILPGDAFPLCMSSVILMQLWGSPIGRVGNTCTEYHFWDPRVHVSCPVCQSCSLKLKNALLGQTFRCFLQQ